MSQRCRQSRRGGCGSSLRLRVRTAFGVRPAAGPRSRPGLLILWVAPYSPVPRKAGCLAALLTVVLPPFLRRALRERYWSSSTLVVRRLLTHENELEELRRRANRWEYSVARVTRVWVSRAGL
eukprot:scaffold32687_cov61-Phaeocystis_antarctica.AAC.2